MGPAADAHDVGLEATQVKGPPADAHDAGPGFKWKGPQLMLMMLALRPDSGERAPS